MLGTIPGTAFGEDLLAGEVGYQVTAIGANGAESVKSGEVTLAKGEPLLRRLAVAPLPYDPRAAKLTFSFDLRESARVAWTVVDAEGKALTDEATVLLPQGPGTIAWDGRNRSGAVAEPGVYRVQLKATAYAETDAQAKAFPLNWAAVDTGDGTLSGSGGVSAAGGRAGPAPAGTATAPPGAAGAGTGGTSGAGDASTAGGNNGVRDHGQGEGRDGAGQGKGQGSESGAK